MKLLVVQHVPYERLGTFEAAFKATGCVLQTLHVYEPNAIWPSVRDMDGLVIMGGPQSVYEQAKYPYLTIEREYTDCTRTTGAQRCAPLFFTLRKVV